MKVFGHLNYLFKNITLTSYLNKSVLLQPRTKQQNIFGKTMTELNLMKQRKARQNKFVMLVLRKV